MFRLPRRRRFLPCILVLTGWWHQTVAGTAPAEVQERMVEWTIESSKEYADPFNDVDVDVIFRKDERSWRVPTFWRGGQRWTVRFAPPLPGEYTYRLESTDFSNPDLNGHEGHLKVSAYSGTNSLLRHGMLRVSESGRYFEHADGTPFFWLGDTWWTGLSDRLSWQGFQTLAADRDAKGFTVIQIVAGLVPSIEELAPTDPGFCNEGGCVWEPDFKRINPRYFDYADRRISNLLDHELVPAIFGGWCPVLRQMGLPKMKQHWRYIIARYGAYPVFWIVGGEVFDPPKYVLDRVPSSLKSSFVPGWSEVAKYVRSTDPYHHPLTAHEAPPPLDAPLRDDSLLDFDMLHSSHFGWGSVAVGVAQMGMHYARTFVKRPIVQGEIGYEKLGETHLEDFQRIAFWLSMLNGAAGHTYGANGVWEAYTADKPLHRLRWSFMSWEEGMNLPGSYQVGLGAKLFRRFQWWRFTPHPEWITPRGTTLLRPRTDYRGFDLGLWDRYKQLESKGEHSFNSLYALGPSGEWRSLHGTFRAPYAAGVPGEVRVIYIPAFGLTGPAERVPPTVLGLELGVVYNAYFWEPTHGIRVDLGKVERPPLGSPIFDERSNVGRSPRWEVQRDDLASSRPDLLRADGTLVTLKALHLENLVVEVGAASDKKLVLLLRYQDRNNYIAAIHSPEERSLYLLERIGGVDGFPLGRTLVPSIGPHMRLTAEMRDSKSVISMTDGKLVYTTPIVDIQSRGSGAIGLFNPNGRVLVDTFSLRHSPVLQVQRTAPQELYDALGQHRGTLVDHTDRDEDSGGAATGPVVPGNNILLDAFRPETLPTSGDWLMVLEATQTGSLSSVSSNLE